MDQSAVQTLFREGKYKEALQRANAQQFMDEAERIKAQCYKGLILCLRGELKRAESLIDWLDKQNLVKHNQGNQFIVLALKTILRSYQGKEKELYQIYTKSIELLEKLEREIRTQLIEWEAWFQYGMGMFNFLNLYFDKPVLTHFNEALRLFDQLPEKGGKEWIYLFTTFFYSDSRNLKEADECYEKLKAYASNRVNPISKILVKMAKGIKWAFKGDLKKANEIYEQILPLIEKENLNVPLYLIYHGFGVLAFFKGDIERAMENYIKAIQIMNDKGFFIPVTWLMLVQLYTIKGEYNEASELISQLLTINTKNNNQGEIAQNIRLMGAIRFYQGNFKEAFEKTEESLKLSSTIKNCRLQALCLNNLGYFYYSMGKLGKSIQQYNQALYYAKELHKSDYALYGKYSLSMSIQSILADLYTMRGEFDLGLDLLQDSLIRTKELKEKEADGYVFYPGPEAELYLNLGKLHFKKAEYLLAKSNLKNSLEILLKFYENPLFAADTLFNIVLTCCELGELDEAQQYFNQLEKCKMETKKESFHHQIQVAKGVLFKKNPRIIMKAQAQEIFQNILKEENLDYDLRVYVLLNLIEILVWELSSTGHETVLIEIEQILNEITKIAANQKSIMLEIEVGLIQSQFELIQGNMKQAMNRLEELTQVALDNHLQKYQIRIEGQQKVIKTELNKWIELTEQNAPLIDRLRQSQVEDYLATALRLAKGPGQDEKIQAPSN
ncbi:MAG: tetratricopeptide repeat protein [Candidatus Hodarchaeota archaeon]